LIETTASLVLRIRDLALVEIERSSYRHHEMATPAMLTMTAKELKNRTGEALRAVARGQRVLVTRRGRPLAVMAPASVAPLEPDERPYEEAWREIEAALRATAPPEASWRRAMDRSRRRP
jgi:prevent-host-death family protein